MPVSANDADVDIDLGRLAAAVWRRRVRVAAITLGAAALAAFVALSLDPLYKGEIRILIADRQPVYSIGPGGQRVAEADFDEASVASQVEIIKSADLIKKVATGLDLAAREEFSATEPSFLSRMLVGFGVLSSPHDVPAGERVLKAFLQKLDVYVVPSSRIIAVEFSSEDPELAADVANALADAYLAFNAGLKIENNSDASAWLEPEIAELRERVRESEERVARYRAVNGMQLVNEQETIAARQLGDISTELSRVRGERADAEARARSVRAALGTGQALDSLGDVLGSATVQRLRERESALRAALADLSTTLLNEHPRMKALRAQTADVEAQVTAETRKVLASLENNARLAAIREEELVGQLNQLKSNSATEGEAAVELRSLEREAAAQRELLETYLARYRESSSRTELRSAPADARVISRAVPASEAYFPKTVPIIVVAALAAFLLATVWVMLAELLSGRALRPAAGAWEGDLPVGPAGAMTAAPTPEAAAGLRPSASGFSSAKAASSPALSLPNAADEASDFSVEAVAEHLLADGTPLAICVSPEGDRASASAVMLARSVAGEGARVLLVDLTASACPTELMAESRRLSGLTDLLCGEVAIAASIHADRLSAAQIVPHGNADARRAMGAIERLAMILDVFADAYDLVIVECGSATAASVERIARREDAEIILSFVRPDEDEIAAALGDFYKHGFEDVLLMAPKGEPDGPGERSAVA